MKHSWVLAALLCAAVGIALPSRAEAACSYFAALNQDIAQPSQRAFITWDPATRQETFVVQPKFEGNAQDFGMVIPTPTRPMLKEAPRDFFKDLALYTVLVPRPCRKRFSARKSAAAGFDGGGSSGGGPAPRPKVEVLEAGSVGTLDYKIIKAEDAGDLYDWLKENKYSFAGDESTLDFYVRKAWIFTVMKIDPSAMKRRDDGTYEGFVSPTRFAFESPELVYPLHITQISVKARTEALLYIATTDKIELKRAKLEWAKRLTAKDIEKLGKGAVPIPQSSIQTGPVRYHDFKDLQGWLQEGLYVTKLRRVFRKEEMVDDLVLGRAPNNREYTSYEDCGNDPP